VSLPGSPAGTVRGRQPGLGRASPCQQESSNGNKSPGEQWDPRSSEVQTHLWHRNHFILVRSKAKVTCCPGCRNTALFNERRRHPEDREACQTETFSFSAIPGNFFCPNAAQPQRLAPFSALRFPPRIQILTPLNGTWLPS